MSFKQSFFICCCLLYFQYVQAKKKQVFTVPWEIIVEPGFTNIDLNAKSGSMSWSSGFYLDNRLLSIPSNIVSYDSRQNYFPPSVGPFTDQANRYLISLKNSHGWIWTLGMIHDKRENRSNDQTIFRYTKGGFECTILAGKRFRAYKDLYVQARVGPFLSFNNIEASVKDQSGKTYTSSRTNRRYAGFGIASMLEVGYSLKLSTHWGVFAQINESALMGKANTQVIQSLTKDTHVLKIRYANLSTGVGLGCSYGF